MNSILEKNVKSLKELDKDIREYFEIEKHSDQGKEDAVCDLTVGVEEIENRKVLYVIKEGKQYQLDSLYDDTELLNRWFCQIDNKTYRSRYLLFGLGNGMYVRKLLKEAGEETAILVVEPSKEIFTRVMEEFDISDILANEKVVLIVDGISDKSFIDYLREMLQYEDMLGAVCRSYLNYPLLFEAEYQKFHQTIKHHSNTVEANNSVMARYGWRYFSNSAINYAYYVKGKSFIALNKKLPKDIPAILVSAGPSLDKNIQFLKEAKGKAFLLAVDSAASALIKNGILPDMTIMIDALKNIRHYADERVQKVPLITNMFANRDVLALHTGDKYFLHDRNTYIEEFFKKIGKTLPEVAGGGSVATDGFALLERLQFKTIILVGQDLAYTDRKTHSADTVRGKLKQDINEFTLIEVEDVYGNSISSSYEFQIYQDWFEEEIAAHSEFTVIDATEGGAKITGTQIMPLQEAIQRYCTKEVDLDEILSKVPYRLNEKEQEQFLEHMRNVPIKLREQLKLVQENLRVCKELQKSLHKVPVDISKIRRLQRKMEKNNESLEKDSVYFFTLCAVATKLNEEFPNGLLELGENKEEEKNKVMDDFIRYYEIMEERLETYIQANSKLFEEQDIERGIQERRNAVLERLGGMG